MNLVAAVFTTKDHTDLMGVHVDLDRLLIHRVKVAEAARVARNAGHNFKFGVNQSIIIFILWNTRFRTG